MEKKIIHDNKSSRKTYISQAFPQTVSLTDADGESIEESRNIRIISKVIDSEEQFSFTKIKNEIIIRKTDGGRQEIIAKIFEDTRGITVLSFQRYTSPSGKPHETSFSFVGNEIETIREFLQNLNHVPIQTISNSNINDETVKKISLPEEEKNVKAFIIEHQEILSEFLSTQLTKEDIIALGYRKKQLETFHKLLSDSEYFEKIKTKYNVTGDEAIWQKFFEKNTWIFGYGLSYVFNTPLDDTKLEQVVAGSNFSTSGKRIDALLKTKGIIESFCFGEIKTHKSPLLKKVVTPYRPESWQISDEITGAIAQVQRTVQKSIKTISTKTEITDKEGIPTGEKIFLYTPKSFIVIGSLSEFETPHGVNEDKYSSFEMFRQGLNRIDIITFDELFQRASFIVKNSEKVPK